MSKENILGDIRRSLRRQGALDSTITNALTQRLGDVAGRELPVDQRPAVDDDLCGNFMQQLVAAGASVSQAQDNNAIIDAIQAFRKAHHLQGEVVVNEDEVVSRLAFPEDVQVNARVIGEADELSVTGALCAVAETGSIVARSGPSNATRSQFLPDNHIVVIRRSQLVRHLEDVWPLALDEAGRMPRSLNLITGPSKTADVEQTLQHGAHGPCNLHVIVVDG